MRKGIPLLVLFAVAVLAFVAGRRTGRIEPETQVIVTTDTLVIFDTIVRARPVLVASEVIRHDTALVRITEHDTVAVELPIERKVYHEDSLYHAVVSGYRATLDSLVVWPKETVITIDRTVQHKAPKWSFGVTAGPSVLVGPTGNMHAGIGASVGITCRF